MILQISSTLSWWEVYFYFLQGTIFYPPCHLKLALFRLESYHEWSRFFVANRIVSEALISQISQTSKFMFPTESFWGSMWLVSFDGLCNYLDLFWRQPGIGFLKKATAAFFNREPLAIKQTYLVKQDLTYSSNTV